MRTIAVLLFTASTVSTLPKFKIPEHCGTKGLPNLISLAAANSLSEEFAKAADFIYNTSSNTKEGVTEVMRIGSTLEIPYEERALQITNVFAEMLKQNKTDPVLVFNSKYETSRIEHWSRNLQQLGLDATKILRMAMSYPWERTTEWKEVDEEGKKKLIFKEIRSDLCHFLY